MNDFDLDTLRISLHILAACVWVGGQVVLGALVPVLRDISPDAPKKVANQFAKVAWPAFGLAVVTGIWNLLELESGQSTEFNITLGVKLLLVTAAGTSAAVHSLTPSPAIRGITGAVGLVGSIAAVVLGVMLVRG